MNKIKLLNIDKIIQNDSILNDDYVIVQKFEDKISELYKTDNNSEIIDEDLSILYDITENNNYNIKIYSKPNLSIFKLESEIIDLSNNFVFGGSYIRSIFNKYNLESDEKLELELHLYPLSNIDFEKLSIIGSYIETPTMFYKKVNNLIVYLNKFKSKSIGEVLLNNSYIKRCIFYKERLYCSPMFILEYALNKDFISTTIIDPVFHTKIDLFGIYPKKLIKKDTLIDLINLKDFESFKSKLIEINLNESCNDILDAITPIEYAMKLFINETCLVIRDQIKLIIAELFKNSNFIRHPAFYAELLNLTNIDEELFSTLSDEKFIEMKKYLDRDTLSKLSNLSNLSDIDDFILKYYIELDLEEKFYSYIKFLNKRLSGNIINYLIKYSPEKIIKYGIKRKLFSRHHLYKIILESEELQHFSTMSKAYAEDIDQQMMMNYFDTIINNCLSKSFYYMYKLDHSILSIKDDDGNTILHLLSEENFNEKFINLILTLGENLLMEKNNLGETPLLMHSRRQHHLILNLLLQYIIHNNMDSLLEDLDNDKNSIYHILSKSDSNLPLFKLFIQSPSTKLVINKQNSSKQTPIIISTIHQSENIFYLLQTSNADLSIKDAFSNSVYHYVCLNEMCIGMAIEDKPNIFGFTPSDYCKISKTYYHFI
jgi:hypothetical protein